MKKSNLFLFIIIIVGLFTTMVTIFQRVSIESENKTVEFTLDYNEVKKLALQSDEDLKWWLEKFRDLGVSSVALNEETFNTLTEDGKELQVEVFKNIRTDVNWKENYADELVRMFERDKIGDYDLVVITKSVEAADFILEGLEERYPEEFWNKITTSDEYLFTIKSSEEEALYTDSRKLIDVSGEIAKSKKHLHSSKVADIGLGFDKEKIELIKSVGLDVLPRPVNYSEYSIELVDAFIKEIKQYDIKPSVIIFGGDEILGYEEGINNIYNYMNKNGIKVGLVESSNQRQHLEQEGIEKLTEFLTYDAVRIFSTWEYIQRRFEFYNYEGAEEIENSFYRAITERNIRLVYFRPFKINHYKYVTDYTEYEKAFDRLKVRLNDHGISMGEFSTMDYFRVSSTRLILIGWGLAALGVLLLMLLFGNYDWRFIILLLLSMFCITGMVFVSKELSEKILALSASVIFPSLSVLYLIKQCKKIILNSDKKLHIKSIITKAITTLIICSFIALVGGLFIGAILGDIRYLLEVDIFKGVKASQITPIVFFIIIFIIEFGYDRKTIKKTDLKLLKKDFIGLMDQSIKIKYVILGSIAAVIGYFYISRTGHETSIQPTDIEMIFRNFLENTLIARPRLKEFLVGAPAIILCIYLSTFKNKRVVAPFALAATVGLASIVNTFSHLRTPVYISVIRTIFSIIFGSILGIVAVLFLAVIVRFFKNRKGVEVND